MKKLVYKLLLIMLLFNLPAKTAICEVLKATISESTGVIGLDMAIGKEPVPIVENVFPDSPCFKAGLKAGDKIISIDNRFTYGLTMDEVDCAISDIPGTKVNFTVIRNKITLHFNVTVEPLHKTTKQLQKFFSNN